MPAINFHQAMLRDEDERHCIGTTIGDVRQAYARYTCEETGRRSSFAIFAAFVRERMPGKVRNVGDFYQRFIA